MVYIGLSSRGASSCENSVVLGAVFASAGVFAFWLLTSDGGSPAAETAPPPAPTVASLANQRFLDAIIAPNGRVSVIISREEGTVFCYFDAWVTYQDGKVTAVAGTSEGVQITAGQEITGLRPGRENMAVPAPVYFEGGQLVAGYDECTETSPWPEQ